MSPTLPGLHHVTAITANGQRNLDFYTGVLGLRLIKVTVNFDDPASYHLYYGDALGRPGTAMTFFVWEGVPPGRVGAPQAVVTQFAVPVGSLAHWAEHLTARGIEHHTGKERFGHAVLTLRDPDDMPLELVAAAPADADPYAIQGFFGVTLASGRTESTAHLLASILGYTATAADTERRRFQGSATSATTIDLLTAGRMSRGHNGAGTVHHIALRVPDDAQQEAWLHLLREAGMNVSSVMDRCYFRSIYFREPGGILFEIATDGPGFTADEPADQLGRSLRLPPWMEPQRAAITAALPPLAY
jgi:glyoxalase family protein